MADEYQIIVESRSEADAKAQLLAWFDRNPTVYQRLLAKNGPDGSEDLLWDIIRAGGGGTKFQIRIRRSFLGE